MKLSRPSKTPLVIITVLLALALVAIVAVGCRNSAEQAGSGAEIAGATEDINAIAAAPQWNASCVGSLRNRAFQGKTL